MIHLRRGCLDYRMKEACEDFGISAFEGVTVSICKKSRELLEEVGGHLEFVFWVHAQLEVSHASQKVLNPRLDSRFGFFGDLTGRELGELANETVADGEEAERRLVSGKPRYPTGRDANRLFDKLPRSST